MNGKELWEKVNEENVQVSKQTSFFRTNHLHVIDISISTLRYKHKARTDKALV